MTKMETYLCKLLVQSETAEGLRKTLWSLTPDALESLIDIARRHNLTAVLYQRILHTGLTENVPKKLFDRLHHSAQVNAAHNLRYLWEASAIIKALHKANLAAISLKGLYLLENIYGDVALRSMVDLDILLKKEEIPSAITLMQSLGYEPTTYFNILDKNQDIKHVPPLLKKNGPYLELHWTLLEENEPFSIDTHGLWERAIPAQIAGIDVLALSVEDLVLHLCMHLTYQHRLKLGLRGLYDIAKVLEYYEEQVDWTKLVGISKMWGAERVTWISLMLAQDLLGAQIPPIILNNLKPKEVAPWVLVEAKAQLLQKNVRQVMMTPDLAEFAAKKGLISRIKLLLNRVFLPKQTLARLYSVSPKSIKIYGCYFKRFIYLLIHYGESLNRVAKKDPQVQVEVKNEIAIERLKKWMAKK